MIEPLMRMDREVAAVLIVFGLPTLAGIIWILAAYWHKVRRAEIEAGLKLKMLDQGMSADEIVRVLQVSSQSDGERRSSAVSCRG